MFKVETVKLEFFQISRENEDFFRKKEREN